MNKSRVLVVDDEKDMLDVCEDILRKLDGVEVVTEHRSEQAAEWLKESSVDLLIADVRMPGLNGVELLRRARQYDPHLPALMMTAFPTVETAVESMKLGASDYIVKPFLPEDLSRAAARLLESRRLKEENRLLGRYLERGYHFDDMLGESHGMRSVFETIQQVADTDTDILIVGETGTGKELVARSIHKRSPRRDARFVPVDCGAIPESLMESEFFGHERGAFTGAHAKSLGLLELADGGTFFLDELVELPFPLQSKLLRALQERKFRRVGGKTEISVDVRIVAASSRNLIREIEEGRFREDLFYRINVVRIDLPPLCERDNDVALLADHFVSRCSQEVGRPVEGIDEEALEVLRSYSWPGNVRELQNVVRRAITLTKNSTLTVDDLPDEVVTKTEMRNAGERGGFFRVRRQRLNSFEKDYLSDLLSKCEGDTTRAAKQAEVPRGTLYRLLKKHGLRADEFRG